MWKKRLLWLIKGLIVITVAAAVVTLWCWYQEGGGFEAIYVAIGVAFSVLLAAWRWLKQVPETETAMPKIPEKEPTSDADNNMITLWRKMEQTLNLDELMN